MHSYRQKAVGTLAKNWVWISFRGPAASAPEAGRPVQKKTTRKNNFESTVEIDVPSESVADRERKSGFEFLVCAHSTAVNNGNSSVRTGMRRFYQNIGRLRLH